MTLYVISGLGADFTVLQRIQFPKHLKIKYIPWIIPAKNEKWDVYVRQLSRNIDETQPFCLLGYSFGGIIAQEMAKTMKPEKVVIMGSPRHHSEGSVLMKLGRRTQLPALLPTAFYGEKNSQRYLRIRRWVAGKNSSLGYYFQVRDAFYLKWSIRQILRWKAPQSAGVIQILADRDLLFPASRARPDYIIANATHLFPATHAREVSQILAEIFAEPPSREAR